MPSLQIGPLPAARFINLCRLLSLLGLLSLPFQGDLRTATERSTIQLTDGEITGIVQERHLKGRLWGYRVRQAHLPESGAPASLRPIAKDLYAIPAEAVKSIEPVYTYHLKALIAFPFRFLYIFHLVWLLHLPALLLWPVYEAAALIVCLFNMLYALVTEQNHPDLSRFLVRAHLYRWKLLLSLNTEHMPHVDIHGREKTSLPVHLTATIDPHFSRIQVLARLAVPFLLYAGYRGFLLFAHLQPFVYATLALFGLLLLPFALFLPAQVLMWMVLAMKRNAPNWLLEILYRPQRFLLHLACWWQGLTSDSRCITKGLQSIHSTGNGTYDPAQGDRIELNTFILFLLVVLSGGIYTLIWIGRTARLMHDDPFTTLLLCLLGALLPLSFIMARYYRRSEIMLKTPPSWLIEIMMMLPGLNLLFGPFVIQQGLNLLAKSRSQAG